jgi:hypothetical protein
MDGQVTVLSDLIAPLMKQILTLRERALGPEHPDVAHSLYDIAELLERESKLDEAELHYQRALSIWERTFNSDDPYVRLARLRLERLRD